MALQLLATGMPQELDEIRDEMKKLQQELAELRARLPRLEAERAQNAAESLESSF